MGTRGPAPKPTELKRRLGNPGKRALPKTVTVLPMAGGVPDAPADLGLEGRELWSRVWAVGQIWISPASDTDIVVETCRLKDDLAEARTAFRATRDPKHGALIVNLSKSLVSALATLAFTPKARTELGVAEVTRVSKLAKLQGSESR